MKGQTSIAILCHILVNLQLPWGNSAAPDSSGERVHIRLHMPEVVRQHTHLHKVYKYQPPPLKKLLPVAPPGKAHVSLLGYTTMAGGTGKMAPSLMQLMATVAPNMSPASALTPNYGPALFESYNQEIKDSTPATSSSGSSFLATAPATMPGTVTTKQQQQLQQQQQMLQQLLKPNIIAALTAAATQQQEQVPELEPEPEPELEQNELLNGNFLAALQQELVNKFGYENQKPKNVKPTKKLRRPQKQQELQQQLQHFKYIQDLQSNEQFDDYNEEPGTGFEDDSIEPYEGRQGAWRHHAEAEDEARAYDSAAAFSGQNNAIFPMDVDEFLQDVSGTSSYPPYNGNVYDDYDPTEISHNSWQTTSSALKSHARPTKPSTSTNWRSRSRRPIGEFGSGFGTSSAKARYVKLARRKKRKNRIKSKRYI